MHTNQDSSNHSQSGCCMYLASEGRYRVCNYR